ncbi:c-type cytochrome domain-containing protein [Aquirufa rosea]|uniref:Ribonuclease inhibitor n=1 Tax=Aquirufa rosea TaxID=2509241 RepID=A0A4Q1BXC8_9BACT|nr:c-type cytochrome domain-containing protein [Aquirufa rosea]RXK46858.1 ribonuclease inhibitor [Aquirufa rosea]
MIGGESEQIPDWIIFWGHFHPMLVHLPIGMFIMGCILYVFSKKEETQRQHQIVPILWSTGITGIISCTMGWGLSQTGEYEENTLFLHQWLGISVTISSLALAYMAKHWSKDSLMRRFFKPLFFLSFLLLLVTGHLGGNMTHGSDYLSTYLPQPWRSWIGIAPKEKRTNEVGAKIIKIKNLKEALVYQDLIQPTLEQKCWSCHNAEKQKGKLRMDSPENLLKGGANGPVFLAGNPLESEMIKRVLLEASHEDHMPPKGKISLTEDEIKLLQWWVKEGAHFNKKIAEIPQDNQIKNILSRYTDGNKNSEKYVSPVLLGDIPAASESDIEKLRKHQLVVITLSSEKPFLEINAINAPKIGDKELRDVEGVKNQVVSLKLGNTQLTDAFLDQISNYPRIIQLQLDHTRISDKGIEYLGTMPHLETINLVGTSASDVGMKALSKIKTLRKVYLWQTKVSEKGIKDLQKSLPKLMIDQGWEGKWPIDTLKFPIKKPE